DYAGQVSGAANESFIIGWQQSMWVGVAVMATLALVVALRGPRTAQRDPHVDDSPTNPDDQAVDYSDTEPSHR
ncbi:hypothetical protein PJN34_30575, partial [Mycobacterium kansasii]